MSANEHRFLEPLRLRNLWEVDAYAQRSLDEVREPVAKVAGAWLGKDEELAAKAQAFLAGVSELAIVPLLETKPESPEDKRWLLDTVAAAELALRKRLIARIESLLDDRTEIPLPPPSGPVERRAPRRRVCDHAYVLMRQVVHLGEDAVDAQVEADLFMNLPEKAKDEEIAKARRQNNWHRVISDGEMNAYLAS